MRRVVLKSPVLENCTPGSERGAPGNRRPYLAKMGFRFIFLYSLGQPHDRGAACAPGLAGVRVALVLFVAGTPCGDTLGVQLFAVACMRPNLPRAAPILTRNQSVLSQPRSWTAPSGRPVAPCSTRSASSRRTFPNR